jgi:hypothetical protein
MVFLSAKSKGSELIPNKYSKAILSEKQPVACRDTSTRAWDQSIERNLSDSMPVNDNPLSVEFVCELHMNYISSSSTDCWTRELAIDSHHNIFYPIWRPVHVLHFPFVKMVSSLIRSRR